MELTLPDAGGPHFEKQAHMSGVGRDPVSPVWTPLEQWSHGCRAKPPMWTELIS